MNRPETSSWLTNRILDERSLFFFTLGLGRSSNWLFLGWCVLLGVHEVGNDFSGQFPSLPRTLQQHSTVVSQKPPCVAAVLRQRQIPTQEEGGA